MAVKRFILSILSDNRGAAMVEFTIIMVPLLVITFGIVDFGHALYQWNSAEKATQAGVRIAVISEPVSLGLADFDCANDTIVLGTHCRDGGTSFGTIVCNGATSTCSGASGACADCNTFSPEAFNAILAPMQQMFPRIEAANVIVEYREVGLGFAGRESPVPAVTVRLTGLTFDFVAIGQLLGFGSLEMPDFRATLTGEDLSSAGA